MPLYSFAAVNGNAMVEKFYAMADAPRLGTRVQINGKTYVRVLDTGAAASCAPDGNWPMESVSQGVNPKEIKRAMELDHARGTHAEYNPENGNVRFTSRAHRNQWLRAHGKHDWDGGYCDP